MTGRSGWWIPPIVFGAGGRWEGGRVVFFPSCQVFWDGVSSKCQPLDPPTDGALRADYMQSRSTFTWALYLNTVFWISVLYLRLFGKLFWNFHSTTFQKSGVLLAPLHIFFFFMAVVTSEPSFEVSWWFFCSLKRQTVTRFVPHRRKTSGCGCSLLTGWRERENVSNVPEDWIDHMNNMIINEWMNERTNVEIKSAVLNVPNTIQKKKSL